jgi:hypothetical protein
MYRALFPHFPHHFQRSCRLHFPRFFRRQFPLAVPPLLPILHPFHESQFRRENFSDVFVIRE